jgi:hypothetical protein
MGDDWDWPEVRRYEGARMSTASDNKFKTNGRNPLHPCRAVEENACKHGKTIYAEADKCWTYVPMTREELQPIRQLYVTYGPARREVSADKQ